MAMRITWRDDRTEMTPANGAYLTHDEVRSAIGGDDRVVLENVYLGDGTGRVMIVDGDGHDKGLPLNMTAGALYGVIDAIAGDVVVMSHGEWCRYDEQRP